jgi:hypothetical protein
MKILLLLLFSSLANSMPLGSGGGGMPFARVNDIPTAEVHAIDSHGNDGVFRALGLSRRTALHNLIRRVLAGDERVIEILGSDFRVERFSEYFEDDRLPENIFHALAEIHQIELIIYETNNDSVATRVFAYTPTGGGVHRATVIRHGRRHNHYDRLVLPALHENAPRVRLDYRSRPASFSLLHEPHRARVPILTIVFDLDETLVFNRHEDDRPATIRPHAIQVLRALRQIPGLEIVLWTASTREAALPALRQLEQDGLIFDEVIYRDHRWMFDNTNYVKDLRRLGRNLQRVVMIENSLGSSRLDRDRTILVEDFVGDQSDTLLLALLSVLNDLIFHVGDRNRVGDALQALAGGDAPLYEMEVPLSAGWQAVLEQYPVEMRPPHGRFYKIKENNQTSAQAASGPTHPAFFE